MQQKLRIVDLAVESFEVLPQDGGARGTVRGHEEDSIVATDAPSCPESCDGTCGLSCNPTCHYLFETCADTCPCGDG